MFCFQELPGKFEYDNSLHVSTALFSELARIVAFDVQIDPYGMRLGIGNAPKYTILKTS